MIRAASIFAATSFALTFGGPAQADTSALCLTPDQAIEVQAVYKVSSGARLVPAMAARQLDPEVVIASAMPAVEIVGTSAESFEETWTSVTK